jgi:filamentous hemagglutinin family protein
LYGLTLLHSPAHAAPVGGFAEVNSGGGMPTITSTAVQTTVKLNAPRTVVSWSTFNVTPAETVSFQFDARDWIVLNRITGLQPSKIEGVVEGRVGAAYGGNIWFSSQSSIIFGKGSRVDAGGLFAGIGTPDISSFLNPTNTLFSFNGGDALSDAKIMVLTNASLAGHGGLVAMVGPSLITRANATVTSSDGGDVLFGGAKTFQIRLAPGAGGDFDLVDFVVPDLSGGTTEKVVLDLAGETRANSVFVAAVSKSAIGSVVINLEGLVTAQAAETEGGDIVLSGGGGIVSRTAGPSLSGAAPTDLYLNRVTASRDLRVQNVGRLIANPWPRPPSDDVKDPPTLEEDANPPPPETEEDYGEECYNYCECYGNGGGNSQHTNQPAPLDGAAVLSSLFNPSAISTLNAGRDVEIKATANIQLGRIVSGRDIAVEGPELQANSLVAGGGMTVRSTAGEIRIAGVGVNREGVITSATDTFIDAIGSQLRLTIDSGRDITLGDGASAVSGAVNLSAARNVTLDLASAQLDTITAGDTANLRGGALDIGSVTAPRLLARAASVKIGSATSTGDVYAIATSGDAVVGSATAGDDVFVIATHGTASLGSAALTGQGPDGVSLNFSGNPDAAGNGRVVSVESTDLDAKLGLATGSVTGATTVTVRAGRDAILQAPTIRLDSVQAGRDLSVTATGGDFTVTENLTATRNITIGAAGALRVAEVRADAGSISLTGATVTAGAVSASEDLTLKALSGGVTTTSYRAGRDLVLQGSSLSLGSAIAPVVRDLYLVSLGNFTASSELVAGRDLTLDVAGKATVGRVSAAKVRIVAGDLDLTSTVTAPTVQIESRSGAIRVGGAAGDGAGQLVLDNADFGQLRASGALKIYAGSTTSAARGDLTLQNLTITPGATPNVIFLAGSNNNALVQGAVAPTTSGGVLRIGDATDLSWRPASILVTGALGAATLRNGTYSDIRAFNEVRLASRNDILMGSQRFITLIQGAAVADIDVAGGRPAGVAPLADEQNRVFVATGKLEVSADNKVVQQNTAPIGSSAVGVFFTGQFSPALIIDPPKMVDLYGAFAGADGKPVTGQAASGVLTFQVVDNNGAPTPAPSGASYKFNSCNVGAMTCSAPSGGTAPNVVAQQSSTLLVARDALPGSSLLSAAGDSASSSSSQTSEEAGQAAVSSETLTSPPVLLSTAAPVDPDSIVIDAVVAGAGSEEIWRERRKKQ